MAMATRTQLNRSNPRLASFTFGKEERIVHVPVNMCLVETKWRLGTTQKNVFQPKTHNAMRFVLSSIVDLCGIAKSIGYSIDEDLLPH